MNFPKELSASEIAEYESYFWRASIRWARPSLIPKRPPRLNHPAVVFYLGANPI